MPFRNCKALSIVFLIGALFLGAPPPSEASGPHRHLKTVLRIVRFRHGVYLREGRAFQEARVSEPPGSRLWVQPTSFTPYDRYLGTVRTVINHLEPHSATMSLACQLMQEGRHFQYVMGDPYTANPPAVTATERAGDCKSKALWLYRGLGDGDALFVIGKASRYSPTSHAWVYWRNENRWWILDCTNRSQPIAADSVSQDRYVPYYSYGRSGAFRHKATCLLINPLAPNSGTPAVADHSAPGGK